ncbi:DinB family protein [Streptantibioticus rubrisoli]|uniref:DinB family protein n=1 Tax=Streptantibioticus rubrisoli TaxID=1387313 RepID=A0ABT1P6Y5_9ACTN|nr:DinB family protein [Streptantibioticus rubrisoli]MCQ4041140.1 DinB family protein [Streptantibioticus rubrisoli]
MSTPERPIPPFNADERATLESWLDFHRTTLAMKCRGLDEAQLRRSSAPPSPMSLLGIVQHMAEVERNWFRRILTGEDVAPIFGARSYAEGPDGGFEVAEDTTSKEAFALWEAEVAKARENAAGRSLQDTGTLLGREVSLRWIYIHMIEEYARHNGHADLIRERIDGATGV